ncbi:MAG: transcription-repair coupling factor [Elusimicrobia bacterium]|nr:transcription-repair coupling factor [Elusimicrobiota bacterium]
MKPATGLPGPGAWGHLARALLHEPGAQPGIPPFSGPLVIVRRDDEDLEDLGDSVNALAPLFGGEPLLPAVFGDDPQVRLGSLERLASGARLVLATPAGLACAAPARDDWAQRRLRLRSGDRPGRQAILDRLERLGYQRVDFVESPGECAVRGAVVDFYALEPLRALRLLFDEDKLASIRVFDPETQAGGALLGEAALVPGRVSEESPTRVRDWLAGGGLWVVEEGLGCPDPGAPAFAVGPGAAQDALDLGLRSATRFEGNLDLAVRQMERWRAEGLRVLLFSLNRGEDERVQELLEGRLPPGCCQFLIGRLASGFVHPGRRLAALTSAELFDRSYRGGARWARHETGPRRRLRWGELKAGDYVVHQDYGIARYLGIEPVQASAEGTLDCLRLEYRGGDKLFVPMTDFKLVQKYVGSEGRRPRLSSLDTRSWEAVKERVKEGVRELAEQLLKTQAARASKPGHAFAPDSHLEEEFARAFPYDETPDQARAIEEVKADMTAPHPMDRVVVGDVGFGKTEVAMRACLKCAVGCKQAAVLVPTTILADQHFRTFSKRFAEYPVRVGMISRFQTAAQQAKTLEDLASGALDIVVGTQRLLSPDVAFRDLGLIVVDEEHRFGVKDKERLKALKASVDVLSLSATPIPRTLHQSLSGLRGVSMIRSAPAGRQPIVTRVQPFEEEAVARAVEEEHARGGQLYYVYNHIESLEARAQRLRELVGGVRVAIAHGQMRAEPLERAMWDFFNRKADVLVASSIIESGLDIPTVNTLLIEDAQDFGLAQLYQLRGRIGRERQRAACYLFYPEGAGPLTENAKKRLEALKEFGELGSGLQLAMRDLEIRGAGDLLGARQHGFVDAVGVEYYCELLTEEVERLRGRPVKRAEGPVQLDVQVPAFIPETYLPGELERLQFYKRLLDAGPRELASLRRELEDLSGPAPEPLENLFRLMSLRSAAARRGLRAIAQRGERVEIYFRLQAHVPPETLARWHELYGRDLEFLRSAEGDGVRIEQDGDPVRWIESFLETLPERGGEA